MKLMLVDDHSLFIEGLRYLLETYEIEVAGVASSGEEAIRKARLLKPDIILMDIKMRGISGIDALKLIKSEMPQVKIAMLTSSEEDDDLFEAVKYGASGYLLKSTDAEELVEMLHSLEKGEALLKPELAARLLKEFKSHGGNSASLSPMPINNAKARLTRRQLEILEMVAKGITYKEVGDMLGLTERTIKYHMGKIISLLHVENRAQVIAYAAQNGISDDSLGEKR